MNDHLSDAAEAIDALRAQRERELPHGERAVQRYIDALARPRFVVAVAAFIACWVVLNAILRPLHHGFDDAVYSLLNTAATLASLVLVFAILSAQRTQGTLERERALLMLQLMLIQDRKATQALKAIEDLRRVDPRVATSDETPALHEETDLHAAAEAMREAENAQEL